MLEHIMNVAPHTLGAGSARQGCWRCWGCSTRAPTCCFCPSCSSTSSAIGTRVTLSKSSYFTLERFTVLTKADCPSALCTLSVHGYCACSVYHITWQSCCAGV